MVGTENNLSAKQLMHIWLAKTALVLCVFILYREGGGEGHLISELQGQGMTSISKSKATQFLYFIR